mmetsp:Transcript_6343/g.14975  ORF Transcript_6343/g.14975 Transcript_6343/m.14975 type:complete len:245 (+) Transcript_6343:527-1261(+)|eukprot:CAMPEP_0113658888 /NCGR_PEP_ID=MMETSP0017_2-20120614/32023_1 /TAXON_ID=2856 /ORGANISM="Cylindrotheca closterium" /LENGTH=244 /DNA_ID=CAMNT_0000573319 /DNA_START=397 /DNA_END=1134 /DNA_ORIENTATION=+ /assembly_acc=CAM_ASM_000147
MKIIDSLLYEHGFVEVALPDGRKTSIDFHCKNGMFTEEMQSLNNACQKVGHMWTRNLDMVPNVRKDMIKLGMVSMCGGLDVEVPSLKAFGDTAFELLRELNVSAKNVCQLAMPHLLEEIDQQRTSVKVPDAIGGSHGLCSIFFQSRNLEDEAHFDYNDLSRCFVIWTSQDGRDHDDWYIVFPNVLYTDCHNGVRVTYEGLAIKLRDGIIVSWDGRLVSHCSTRPSGDDVLTWGTWFGVTEEATG